MRPFVICTVVSASLAQGAGADGTVFPVTAVNVTKLLPINLKEGK